MRVGENQMTPGDPQPSKHIRRVSDSVVAVPASTHIPHDQRFRALTAGAVEARTAQFCLVPRNWVAKAVAELLGWT
jgi:hypothetical protein